MIKSALALLHEDYQQTIDDMRSTLAMVQQLTKDNPAPAKCRVCGYLKIVTNTPLASESYQDDD